MTASDQGAIDALVISISEPKPQKVAPVEVAAPNVRDAIDALKRDAERRALFDGDNLAYPSDSEADAALFHHIAFYSGRDLDTMEQIALSSGRNRKKWQARRGASTWLRQELESAAERTSEVWMPTRRIPVSIGKHRKNKGVEGGSVTYDGESSPFARANLAQALKDGVPEPEALVTDVLLKGKVHSIYSAGGTGKTFMMLYLVKRVVKQGLPVIIFDLENGLRIVAERLEVLGITPEESELIHYYPFPRMPIDGTVIEAYEELLDSIGPALVVFDSWINCLAACGLDENSSVDIATWADTYSQRARHRECAVLILDHVPKEGNTARGSGRKLDYVDVQFELKRPLEFSRSEVGQLELGLRKDREGWLPKRVVFTVGGDDDGFIFQRSAGTVHSAEKSTGLLPSDRKVFEALQALGSMGAFDKAWREEAEARGVPRTTYYRSKKNLVERELVDETMNKFFCKTPAKSKSHLVPWESHGTNETTADGGGSTWSHDSRSGTNGTDQAGTSGDIEF